ncbi:hypothetical protein ACFOWX_13335, partial [Sphingorhabdus arenilitoris]
TAQVTYIYNGLGQVTKKTEATGDAITYTYDTSGRMLRETRNSFTAYTGATTTANITPQVHYRYDGLGNLVRTIAAGAGDATARETRYIYDGSGRLAAIQDASGFIRNYSYDKAGRVIAEDYLRAGSAGGVGVKNGVLTKFDAMGRVIEQAVASWNGTAWVRGDVAATIYNAYSDVAETRLNSISNGQNKYDAAGRLWATTSGDGVWKFFGYDANGNQTIAITSAGANLQNITSFAQVLALVGQEDVTAAYTVYDNRNLATTVTEEGRRLNATGALETLTSSRSYNAFGEVTSETNALGHTLTYTYNNAGKLIKSESPYVNVTAENGAVSNIRPTENYYYDASGRLVASRDANGNLTRLVLLSGTGYN